MDVVNLAVDTREITGKSVKALRKEGMVPAVIHDHGKESILVQAEYQAVAKAYKSAGKHHPIEIKAGSHNYTTLVKDVAVHPRHGRIEHVVFNAVSANQKVTAEIPIHIKFDEGNDSTPAERVGLIVLHQMDTIEVEATASSLPDALYFNGEKLVEVGDTATVADLIVPPKVTLKVEEGTIATVFEPSALQAANEDAGGAAEEEVETPAEEAEGSTEATETKAEDKK